MAIANGQRTTPQDEHAEAALLGAALTKPDIAAIVATLNADEDFYRPKHRHVAAAITTLFRAGQPTDPVSVAAKLPADQLEQIEGLGGLLSLQVNTPSLDPATAQAWAGRLRETHARRRIIGLVGELADVAYDGDPTGKLAELAGVDIEGLGRPATAEIVALVRERLGISDDGQAAQMAAKVSDQRKVEQIRTLARQIVREEEVARDTNLEAIPATTAAVLLAQPREPKRMLLGALAHQGHNVTVTARYKVGKSTVTENVTYACTTAGLFLARFPVEHELRVTYLNYELDEDDMVNRIKRMGLDAAALDRLQVINLRGHRLPITMPAGRSWLTARLIDHATDVMIIDPFGAAFAAAGGENENDNAEVRRFLIALDEIKRNSGVQSSFMPVHTGRGEQTEGDERGRGATVVDDWADVRMILTKDDKGCRYLRTEGRAMDLEESKLGFDGDTGRLMLATSDMGVNRSRARNQEHLDAVVAVVKVNPGMITRELRLQLGALGVKSNEAKDAARDRAVLEKLIHVHQKGVAHRHFLGASHPEDEPCPEGWKG